MNAKRNMHTMPAAVGRVKGSTYTTYWVCLPKVRKDVPENIRRITAFRKAKRRRQILKKLMDWLYVGVCLGSTVFMIITMLNMAGMI